LIYLFETFKDPQQNNQSSEKTDADGVENEDEIKLENVEEEKEVAEKCESSKEDLLNHDDGEAKRDEKSEHDLEIEKRLGHLRDSMHIRAVENIENSDLKSIYLEGELPEDPKILVSATETETKTEKMSHYPSVKDIADDEAVILSGKMTISLISLANNNHSHSDEAEVVEKNGIVEDHTQATTNNVA
jgi:hypothetical protein